MAYGNNEGAMGHAYVDLVFTNTGTVTCTLDGHPGVSYLDARGRQIGPSATRTDVATPTITLVAGGQGHAMLEAVNGLISDDCVPVEVTTMRVFPPDETRSVKLPAGSIPVCSATMSQPQFIIDAVRDDTIVTDGG